jgi:hypothetical protein
LLTQKRRVIKVRIGRPISVAEQNEHEDIAQLSEFLRRKTYMLSNVFEPKEKILKNIQSSLKVQKPPKKVVQPVSKELMSKEVETLRQQELRLLVSKNYEVFLAQAKEIPFILREIGRLREITFREVGEGTNKDIDLDTFDTYYHQ